MINCIVKNMELLNMIIKPSQILNVNYQNFVLYILIYDIQYILQMY